MSVFNNLKSVQKSNLETSKPGLRVSNRTEKSRPFFRSRRLAATRQRLEAIVLASDLMQRSLPGKRLEVLAALKAIFEEGRMGWEEVEMWMW